MRGDGTSTYERDADNGNVDLREGRLQLPTVVFQVDALYFVILMSVCEYACKACMQEGTSMGSCLVFSHLGRTYTHDLRRPHGLYAQTNDLRRTHRLQFGLCTLLQP